jgi:hypothetical protein
MSKFQKIEKEIDDFIWRWSENPFFSSTFIKGGAELSIARGWIPLIIVIYDSNKIIGLAPLAIRRKFGICFAQFLYGPNFLMDIVVNDEYGEACVYHVLRTLTNVLKCKFIDLTFSNDSKTLRSLKKGSQVFRAHFRTESAAFGGHRVVPVTCTWDEFVKMRGKKFRAEARRVERKVRELGNWQVTCVEQIEQGSKVCQMILGINELSWKKKWLSSLNIAYDPELAVTLNAVLETEKKESIFKWKAYFLKIKGAAIAYVLVFQMKGTAIIKRTSYVAAYKRFSPGMFVLNYAIRDLFCRARVKVIDFCADHPYQETWAPVCLPRTTAMIRNGLLIGLMERVLVNTTVRRPARFLKWLLLGNKNNPNPTVKPIDKNPFPVFNHLKSPQTSCRS